MVKTASTMLPLGTSAPLFNLTDVVNNQDYTLKIDESQVATVIMFICNHCPFVKLINDGLVKIANDYQQKPIRFIAINANDANAYPEDAPEKMQEAAMTLGYPFPYLYDETQEVAKAYQAVCTPDFFVFDKHLKLVYRGQFDDARPGNDKSVSGESIRTTLDCLISNKAITTNQKPSIGCNIKWKTP